MKAEYCVWAEEEMVRLADLWASGMPVKAIAAELERTYHATIIRIRRFVGCPVDGRKPQFGRAPFGQRKYWTRERVTEGLRDYAKRNRGKLPTSDHEYDRVKKGHMEWPTSRRVLEQFGTMADAWGAIGADKQRFSRRWVTWTQDDDDMLLSLAGEMTLKQAGARLNRSEAACKRRLYDLGAGRARDVSGHMSAMQVAREYNCPLKRVSTLIERGELKAHRVQGGHYWRISPYDAEAVADKLRAPKRTHSSTPVAAPNYRTAHGIRRVGGQQVAVTPAARDYDARKKAKQREKAALRRVIAAWEAEGRIVDIRARVAALEGAAS